MEAAASHLSGVCSSIQSHPCFLLPPPPPFHFHSLIEVFLQAKCFLIRCSTNYFFNKTLTLNFDFLFKWELSTNGCWETHQMGEHGHSRKKIWPGGIHFMVSLGGGGLWVCVQLALYTSCFIVVFVCGLFTVHVGDLHCWVLVFLCVHQEVRLDYWMCVCVQPLRSRAHYLRMCRCGAVLPPSLVGSWGAAVVPLQISFSVAASSLSGR